MSCNRPSASQKKHKQTKNERLQNISPKPPDHDNRATSRQQGTKYYLHVSSGSLPLTCFGSVKIPLFYPWQPIFYVTTRVLQTNSTQQIKRLPDRLLSLRKPVRTRYRGARSPTTGNIWPYFHTNYFMHGPSLSSPETGNIKRFLPFNTVCTFP